MKPTIIVISLVVLSTLWCADVLAHMDGEIKRHFLPCTNNDPSVDNEQDKQDCIDEGYLGGHGHVDETHDGTTGGEASSWGYWDPCGYAAVSGGNLVNCDSDDSNNNNNNKKNNNNNDGAPGQETSTFTITVVSAPGSGAPGDTLTFVVEVRENGVAKSGETVDFSITSGDGNASLGTPNPATTGSNGQA